MKKNALFILAIAVLSISGCNIAQQIKEIQNFAKCEFRLATLQNTNLGGLNMQNKKSVSDFSFSDGLKLKSLAGKDSWPLSFTLNVEAKNPNSSQAAMNKFEWILFMDDNQLVEGILGDRIEIAPNAGVTTIPLQINIDLKKVLSGKSFDSMLNLVFNITGEGNKPTRFLLKAKPTIMIGSYPLTYPGYIDIKQEFTASMGKEIRNQVVK